MRVLVEVMGRPLDLRGPLYHVGERLFLDTDNPAHREVLAAPGWVRRLDTMRQAALDAPPVDKMVAGADAVTRSASAEDRGKHRRGHR